MQQDETARTYRCVAASAEGFVQQVAVSYIRTGHYFYVAGCIKREVDPQFVDEKIIQRYDVNVSRWTRALRKQRGEANLQYIRHGRFFLLMATHGKSQFFDLEGEQVKDCRRMPIKFEGYSLSFRGGHPHVRLNLNEYNVFKAAMLEAACRMNRVELEQLLGVHRYAPYAPVRRQLWNIWREVNRTRVAAGLDPVTQECLPLRRRIVRPFGDPRWAVTPSRSEHNLAASVEIMNHALERELGPCSHGGEMTVENDDEFEQMTGPETYRSGLTYQGPSVPQSGHEQGLDLNVSLFDASAERQGQGVPSEVTKTTMGTEEALNKDSDPTGDGGPIHASLSLLGSVSGLPVLPKEWEMAHGPASTTSTKDPPQPGGTPAPPGPPNRPRGIPR